MKKQIPHTRDEHEGYDVDFAVGLIPAADEQIVDQGRHIGDGDFTVAVTIGCIQADTGGITSQQIVDQGRDIANGHMAVTVHVAPDEGDVDSEVVGIQFAEDRLLIAVS